MKKSLRFRVTLAAMVLTLAACGSDVETDVAKGVEDRSGDTLAQAAGDDDSISMFAGLLETTGISGALGGEANYTLLAPTDSAIELLGEDTVKAINDKSEGAIAAAIIRDHMVPGALTPDAIRSAIKANGGEITMRTFGTGNLTFAQDGEMITVTNGNGASANLTGASTIASNGTVLAIDAVLADPKAL